MLHGAENFPELFVPRSTYRVITPPAKEPVTLAQAKSELGIYSGDGDARIERMIASARALAESYTGRAFITQEIEMQLDTFPQAPMPWWDGVRQGARRSLAGEGTIALYLPPVQEIAEITYRDDRDAEHTVDASTYYLDDIVEPNRVILNAGAAWPIDPRRRAAVTIRYYAGYGDEPEDVPVLVSEAILAHLRDQFDRPNAGISSDRIDNTSRVYGAVRTGVAAGTGGPSPTGGLRADAAAILSSLRIWPSV